jgi:hypothetical protein
LKIPAEPLLAKELKPGDLFSTAGQFYWDHRQPDAVGEKVYLRTDAPCPKDQEEEEIHRIVVRVDE